MGFFVATVAIVFAILYFNERSKREQLIATIGKIHEILPAETEKFVAERQELLKKNEVLTAELNSAELDFQKLVNQIPIIIQEQRADAIKSSRAVLRGFAGEQFVPFLSESKYKPSDFKGLFFPVDYVIFDGMSQNKIKQIVFLEVKSSETANLTERQRQIRDCIASNKISFEILRIN